MTPEEFAEMQYIRKRLELLRFKYGQSFEDDFLGRSNFNRGC
jgi:hypothetical protein